MIAVDRFTIDVLRSAFSSLVDEMGVMLMRCAMSPVITQGRDFSGAVLTTDGELVMQGAMVLPGHVGTMPFTVEAILEDFGDDIKPGDIFATNDPHRGGTHLPDIRMVKPIFADGVLIAFLINCGHFTDVGGALPSSFVANAKDSCAEGLLMPPVKFHENGVRNEQILNIFLHNCRLPDMNRADLIGLAASLDVGERRFEALIEKYGADTILAMFEEHLESTAEGLREIVRGLPDGSYALTDYIDQDPGSRSDDPIPCVLDLRVQGDHLTFDFSKSADRARGAVNCPLPATTSAVIIALKCVFPQLELCGGINRAITIETRPDSILHALWPAPVGGLSGGPFQKAVDLSFGCLAQFTPERVMACPATETNYVQAGVDPREDAPMPEYIMYCWTEGGYGARIERDNGTYITLFASGSMNQSMELFEQMFPIVWERMELICDSGGAGRTRGGLGDVRRVRLAYGTEAMLSSFGDREKHPAWGLHGGRHGGNQGFVVNPGTPEEANIGVMTTGHDVVQGDFWDFWSGGGGGFGDPSERDPERVLEDVRDGYVSVEGAQRDYGVVIRTPGLRYEDWHVDAEATAQLRESALVDAREA